MEQLDLLERTIFRYLGLRSWGCALIKDEIKSRVVDVNQRGLVVSNFWDDDFEFMIIGYEDRKVFLYERQRDDSIRKIRRIGEFDKTFSDVVLEPVFIEKLREVCSEYVMLDRVVYQ